MLKLRHKKKISIHAPREGGDVVNAKRFPSVTISIHAPREGGDLSFGLKKWVTLRFQSTPPARGATLIAKALKKSCIFQSTPPARGATLML